MIVHPTGGFANHARAYRLIEARPLSAAMGAEIVGASIAALTDDAFAEVRDALFHHKMIFFRDQDITTEQHLAFARNFGELEAHPFAPSKPGYPEVLAITHDRESRGRSEKC